MDYYDPIEREHFSLRGTYHQHHKRLIKATLGWSDLVHGLYQLELQPLPAVIAFTTQLLTSTDYSYSTHIHTLPYITQNGECLSIYVCTCSTYTLDM